MIRGKAAFMIDPTKLMPGMGPNNPEEMKRIIAEKQAREASQGNLDVDSGASSPTQDDTTTGGSSPNPDPDGQNLRHFSKPKVAGRRVRVIKQDTEQLKARATQELVGSELMYATMLKEFSEKWIAPLSSSKEQYGSVPPSQIDICASEYQALCDLSLELSQDSTLSTDPVKAFEQCFDRMERIYTTYVSHTLPIIFATCNALTPFKSFRQAVKKYQTSTNSNVTDGFMVPVSRLSVYELILRKYASTLQGDEQQTAPVLALAARLKAVTHNFNSKDLEASAAVLSMQLQLSSNGTHAVQLWAPGRIIVRQSNMLKSKLTLALDQTPQNVDINIAKGENLRHIVLLSDILLWNTPLEDGQQLKYKGHVSLLDITVSKNTTHNDRPSLVICAVQAIATTPSTNRSAWVLTFDDISTRDLWYGEIHSLQHELHILDQGPGGLSMSQSNLEPVAIVKSTNKGKCTIL